MISVLQTCDPELEKTYLLKCAPNEDSNQSARPHSLFIVFIVRMEKRCFLGQNGPIEDSDQTARMRSLIWIFTGRTYPKVRFLTLRLKCVVIKQQ